MSHLGDRITALVDQRLDPASREQVLCHLLDCPDCRAEADAERAVRRMLAGFGYGSALEPSPGLRARLLVVAEEAPSGTRGVHRTLLFARRVNGVSRDRHRVLTRRPGAPPSRRRTRRRLVLAGSLSIGAATAAVAFVVGGQPSGPAVTPSVDSYTLEHVAVRDSGPLTDPAAGAFSVVSPGPRP